MFANKGFAEFRVTGTFSGPFVIGKETVIEPNGQRLLLGAAAIADSEGARSRLCVPTSTTPRGAAEKEKEPSRPGTTLSGTAGLVPVHETNLADQVAANIKAANRVVSKATDREANQLAAGTCTSACGQSASGANHAYGVTCVSSRSHRIEGSESRKPGGCLSGKDCKQFVTAVRSGASEALDGRMKIG